MEPAQQQRAIDSEPKHSKALLPALEQILIRCCDDPAMFAAGTNGLLERLQFGGNAWSFPLAAMTRARRIIGRPHEKELHTINPAKLRNVPAPRNAFDDRHDQHMFVR